MFRNATAPGPGVNRGSTRRCVRLVADHDEGSGYHAERDRGHAPMRTRT